MTLTLIDTHMDRLESGLQMTLALVTVTRQQAKGTFQGGKR